MSAESQPFDDCLGTFDSILQQAAGRQRFAPRVPGHSNSIRKSSPLPTADARHLRHLATDTLRAECEMT